MFKEFKEFIMRGNVMDLAVGIVIGAAFGKIVTSLVSDILMGPIGLCWVRWTSRVYSSIFRANIIQPQSGQGGQSGDHQLWVVREYCCGFSDCGVCYFYRGQAGQQVEAAACAGVAHYQGMPVLPHHDSDPGDALSELHFAVGVTGQKFGTRLRPSRL